MATLLGWCGGGRHRTPGDHITVLGTLAASGDEGAEHRVPPGWIRRAAVVHLFPTALLDGIQLSIPRLGSHLPCSSFPLTKVTTLAYLGPVTPWEYSRTGYSQSNVLPCPVLGSGQRRGTICRVVSWFLPVVYPISTRGHPVCWRALP